MSHHQNPTCTVGFRVDHAAQVPARNPVQSIPPEVTLTPCVTEIIDTSLRVQTEDEIGEEVRLLYTR